MNIVYHDGPSMLTLGNGQQIRKGEPAEVSDELATALIQQGGFHLAAAAAAATTASSFTGTNSTSTYVLADDANISFTKE
jgi:hypothetical protein